MILDNLAYAIVALTAGVLLLLLPFASHRSFLLFLAKTRKPSGFGSDWKGEPPVVTVQLPIYNELHVVERLIDAAARLRYPLDKLEIQVLDDSSDETWRVAEARVHHWRARGRHIQHLRRANRTGYKAGALKHGLARARGEFVLILDADFIPPSDLIESLLPPFADVSVGMVQARWDHLNEGESWLTRSEALLLDGHFFFEHGGRASSQRFFNFNGTGGMWRRECLDDAGGWSADTLTEDLDISYRAQMKGWRFVFLPEVGVPGELPASVSALESQQKRWAQGAIQTARKILPDLLRRPLPLRVKSEAAIHLLGHLAHPLTLLLGLLLFPSAVARRYLGWDQLMVLDLLVFGAATFPFLLFYLHAGLMRTHPWRTLVPTVLRTLALGIGLSATVSTAVFRGFSDSRDPFRRTPKKGSDPWSRYAGDRNRWDVAPKLLLATVMTVYLGMAAAFGYFASIPFIALFASGYVWLGTQSLLEARRLGPEDSPEKEATGRSPDDQAEPEGMWPDAGVPVGSQSEVGKEYEAA